MDLMGITIGSEAHTFAVRRNEVRIDRCELRASAVSKKGRIARLAEKTSQEIAYEVEEGPMYGFGITD
ncbi:GSCOCG00011061001-RA-CDS [Cotesia congregata]|nr:GSCOCG00011061001-RA-CDS [Cotesia congregata]